MPSVPAEGPNDDGFGGGVYGSRAAFIFISVLKHREVLDECAIDGMPTQIFYDKEGEEVFRHEGFTTKMAIVEKLEKLGVEKITRELSL